jgi:PST family polysaccharide transporter
LQVSGTILSALIGLFMLVRVERIRFSLPSWNEIVRTFRESIPFFISRVSVTINSNIAQTLAGIFLGMKEVAAFDIARKIILVAFIPVQMLVQAIFPHNSSKQSVSFVRKSFYAIVGMVLCEIIFVYLLAPFAVRFFAADALPASITITRILLFFLFFGAISNYLGSPVLVAFGYPKPFNRSVFLSTFVLIACYGVFYLFNWFSLVSFAVAVITAEASIAIYRFHACRKLKIL